MKSMGKKAFRTIVALFIVLLSFSRATFAIEQVVTPTFPSCLNPQGTIQSYYSTGTHGIVGDTKTYEGSDIVYQVSPNTLAQCFCPANGQGIQTNWVKTSSLTQSQIDAMKKDGWIEVPNGEAWGLDQTSYLAKNLSYVCFGGNGGGGNGGGDGRSDGRSSCPECTMPPGVRSSGDVLGLAFTGNMQKIVLSGFLGGLFVVTGLALRKKRS